MGIDTTSGIESAAVLSEVNDPVRIPAFAPGTSHGIRVVLHKQDPWEPSEVTLRFTSPEGVYTDCSFVFIKAAHKHPQKVQGLSSDDDFVFASNFGVRSMVLNVNFTQYSVRMSQRSRLMDLSPHFQRNSNTFRVWGVDGKGDAVLVLWDGSMAR